MNTQNSIDTRRADYVIKPLEPAVSANSLSLLQASPDAASKPKTMPTAKDSAMRRIYELAARVANTDVTVLLQGESGTGKEVIARYIHQHSRHSQGPFVAINCAAIPENMLEAMLFGYEKGAFTGATQAMPGKFEQAQGGVLLLDEIAEMDLALQAKLLRVLQEKEVERLGSQKKIKLNVRILAATNRKLREQLERGLFREDLYYRLSVFPLTLPPLRERVADILPLARELLQQYRTGTGKTPVFDTLVQEKLQMYGWPGNVRELENVIQRALILCAGDKITADDLIFEEAIGQAMTAEKTARQEIVADSRSTALPALIDSMRSTEENLILQTLKMHNGCRKSTAQRLGISARTLRYKMARMKEAGVIISF